MKLDKKTVEKIADLAKLEFDEEAKTAIINDLNKILRFVDKLNELNTDDVEPLIYITEEQNALREDKVTHQISKEDALKNVPIHDSDYIKVPKFIKKKK